MAIVKMKRLHVIAMADRRDELLEGLLRLGCVEISDPEDRLPTDADWAVLFQRDTSRLTQTRSDITDVKSAMDAIRQYAAVKDGLFIQRHPISQQDFLSANIVQQAKDASDTIGGNLQTLLRLQSEESRLVSRIASLRPWQSLDADLANEGTEHVVFRFGVCPASTETEAIRNAIGAADLAAEIYEISVDKLQKYYLTVFHREDEEPLQDVLRPFNFSAVTFPDTAGTAAENIRTLEQDLAENRARQKAAEEALAGSAEEQKLLQVYADRLSAEAEKELNAERLMTDGFVFFFDGWAPAEKMDKVQALLEKTDCAWEASDPSEEELPDVPVSLKNNWLTRPLTMVTEMYSLPAYGTVDPNPLMAPFFILFYGIMMADMGYGLLMFLMGFLLNRKYKFKGTAGHLFGLMTLCGVSTFIMGAITGGFFGDFLTQVVRITTGREFALPALFTPLNDTLMILIGSMCLGFIHIITGMAISVVQKVRNGQVMDAVWNEITWWVVFAGIGLMVLKVTPIVLYLGLAMVVAGPLITGKGIGKVTGIFASLYNNVTGFFGDILSYSRLMALMLAGSVIAQVFNTLGAIPGNIVIFLIISAAGNALNFALNLLGCYVHDLRLQCLEYFGKFYQDGGKPFRPLAINTKYVDVE